VHKRLRISLQKKRTRLVSPDIVFRNILLRNVFMVLAVFLTSAIVPERSLAQNRAPAEPSKGVQILLLGTQGGPVLSKQRSEPATLLIVDGRPYLIDCGIGTMRRMLDAGVQSQTVGTIFLTHNHPDHTLGLIDVLANDFLSIDFGEPGDQQEFNIYGPPGTPALVSAAYNYIKIPYGVFAAEPLGASMLVNPFKVHVIDHDQLAYQDDEIKVTAAENTHYQLFPAKYRAAMKSFSYRFETPYGSIVFTGDTGPSAAVEALAKGADVLVSEVEDLDAAEKNPRLHAAKSRDVMTEHMRKEHLPLKSVGDLASRAQVKALILYHFVGGEDGVKFASGVEKYYSGPVFAGEDLARYCLGAGTAAGEGKTAALKPCQ
jgi:ribonuclease BN (tRNA processing enzyme)